MEALTGSCNTAYASGWDILAGSSGALGQMELAPTKMGPERLGAPASLLPVIWVLEQPIVSRAGGTADVSHAELKCSGCVGALFPCNPGDPMSNPDLRPLHRQVIVITGASSGIGLATARMAAKAGASVLLAARNKETLRRITSELRADGAQAASST